jgi:hypothetical protein
MPRSTGITQGGALEDAVVIRRVGPEHRGDQRLVAAVDAPCELHHELVDLELVEPLDGACVGHRWAPFRLRRNAVAADLARDQISIQDKF